MRRGRRLILIFCRENRPARLDESRRWRLSVSNVLAGSPRKTQALIVNSVLRKGEIEYVCPLKALSK